MRLAFVLTAKPWTPDAPAIVRAYARIAPKAPSLRVDSAGDDPHAASFSVDGADGFVSLMSVGAPVPNNEADEAARFSLSALGTGWTLPPHLGHVMVVLGGDEKRGPIESMRLHTRVVAAVAEASGAVGVYVGDARATHAPRFYIEVVESLGDDLPLMIWTGLSVAVTPTGRLSLLTLGMKPLALPNLLLTAPKGGGNDALGFLFDLLGYFVRRGSSIPAGETVGRTATEKLPVRYEPSPLDPSEQVLCVDVP